MLSCQSQHLITMEFTSKYAGIGYDVIIPVSVFVFDISMPGTA